MNADVISVDTQDLMELTSDIFNSKGTGNPWPVDHLSRGFNPFVAAPVPSGFTEDTMDDSDDDFDDDADDDDDSGDRRRTSTTAAVILDPRIFSHKSHHGQHEFLASPTTLIKEKLEKFWTALLLAGPASSNSSAASPTPLPVRNKTSPKILYFKDIGDILLTRMGQVLLPSLTNAALTLRKAGHNIMIVAGHSPSLLTIERSNEDELSEGLRGGSDTTSMDDASAADVPLITILQKLRSPSGQNHYQHQLQYGHISLSSLTYDTFPGPTQSFHHISIPPFLVKDSVESSATCAPADIPAPLRYALENAQLLKKDKADRIKEINCRNLYSVLRFRGGQLAESESAADVFGTLRGIESDIWGFSKVFRVISNALGSLYLSQQDASAGSKDVISRTLVQNALDTSDHNALLRNAASLDLNGKKNATKSLIRIEECDRYERKLLGSIVDPEKIKTTFENTIISPETIQTLQTMITLPLVRPLLFSYGLLQNEFLSGLLLFGPPGTGKTLLAKAVAKESGARMLEIKASDIFDMYVGEGEKNVSAVFSLARKLSPCVIFLDEVDSMFRARGSHSSGGAGGGGGNSSQREILNQFMVEWDGLRSSGQNRGIVIMASTNRPYELDDAVLRRLPRRVLVDLPSEQAREQILNVYLKQEKLEDGVDVKELAKKTAFFSGSDLKNLCVSAALASVRESIEDEVRSMHPVSSNDKDKEVLDLAPLLNQYKQQALSAVTSKGSLPSISSFSPTSVRVIKKNHFDKALSQITPSCSENMDSLTELRKWDGLYGDGGKGRRKINKAIGFEVDPSSTTSNIKL
ncbi:hypothetical protein EDD11_000583 [Mortierella claussenii]|nr:hypothetical protein EDD11_000583 [Mortierella claussenii]